MIFAVEVNKGRGGGELEIVCIVGAIDNAVDIIHGWIEFIIEKRHVK